ncbi:hypothetical protein EV361DRAFT_951219 [Lentinula raphanica]|nr:hypothetical protein EV361DRAFT_951219 [Lentinula raphanica]
MSNASSIPPLSYATYRLHPDILTRFSDPASTLQSFDGRVGAVLPNDYLISSPNSNVLYAPPLSSRRVRLRRHFHFSHDDPLFYPQPFDETRPHLPLIRTPSPDPNHPFAAAWLIPSAEDFDAEASDFLYNAVVLDTTVYLRLKALADDVLKTINLSEFQSDPYLTQGSLQVDRMLSLLQVAAPREDILLRVAFLQRSILELDARIQYRSQDWNTVIIGKKRNCEIPDCLAVIGAFTDNSSTADTLYCLEIPVWFVRPVKNTPDARIDRVASLIAEDSSRIIELPSGFRVDGTDAEPSHKIIWEGPTNKPECFAAMHAYLQSLLYPSSVFGSHQMQSLSSFQKAISTRATLNHSAGHASSSGLNHPNSTLRSSMRPAPYSQKNRKQPQLHKQGINTFLQLKSPAMPPAISAWARALEYHSTYNQSLRRPETLESGYFLPPPRLLDGPANPSTRAFYYRSWLKIRPFILQSLDGLTKPVNLSAKQWRCLLDVVGGHAPSTSTQTKNAILRNEMCIVVETLITQSSSHSLNLDDPTPQIEEFAGQPVDCKNEPPPKKIASQIIWEISELSFRQELVALDRQLDKSRLSLAERDALLDACWVGSRSQVDIDKGDEGLGAPTVQKRAPYIHALHHLMRSWKGDKPEELHCDFPDDYEAHNYITHLEQVEQALAYFYTTSFLLVFARAASIPHSIVPVD